MSDMYNTFINNNIEFLDKKKQQTTYKIKYITSYVEKWLFVVCNVQEYKKINFIDCMCNAGVYSDGDKGTAIMVLELFNSFALKHQDKEFNLILNDIDSNRLRIIKEVINKYIGIKASNIKITYSNEDVNNFLLETKFFSTLFNCYPNRSANLVFVDPYNFCTVKISTLQKFLSDKYCELLFNIFTSDFVRNQDKPKMKKYCLEENIQASNKNQMIEIIKSRLRIGNILYVFSYEFRTITKNEIYQIMYFTPNIRGLEKLKEALWETFNGKEFYRNEKTLEKVQMSIFTEEDDKDCMVFQHSTYAKKIVTESLKGQTLAFDQIECFILENTILDKNQIIGNVLKPLMDENKIIKLGTVKNKNNYSKDKYQILG